MDIFSIFDDFIDMYYQKQENEQKQDFTICEQQNAVLNKQIVPRENSGRKVPIMNRSYVFFWSDVRHSLRLQILSTAKITESVTFCGEV